jgi:alpha-galactosidase/6-phospho-beta-glucosidase family protein
MYPELKRRIAERKVPHDGQLSARLSEIYGHHILYAHDNHLIEFYPFLAQMKGGLDDLPENLAEDARERFRIAEANMPDRGPPSPEVRAKFFEAYQKLLDETEPSPKLSDPLMGEGLANVLGAIATGRRQVCIANIANKGCIPNLSKTAEVEVEAVTDSCGVRGLQMGEAPPQLKCILEKRFVWHELVADAAVKGDRDLALQALMIDEMAIFPEPAEAMLDELLEASKDLLPQFF